MGIKADMKWVSFGSMVNEYIDIQFILLEMRRSLNSPHDRGRSVSFVMPNMNYMR